MRTGLLAVLIIVGVCFSTYVGADLYRHWDTVRHSSAPTIGVALSGMLIFFLSTLGVSDFAVSTAIYTPTKWVSVKRLPGTLNVQGVVPFVLMAVGFIGVVKVDPVTLLALVAAQVVGAVLSPRFVVKLPERTIKRWIACGLIIAGLFILAGRLHLIAGNGTALRLSGLSLIVGCGLQVLYGALNNIGIGSYALTTATIYALGLNPLVAFPIMMSGSALSVAAGSSLFVYYGDYDRKVASIASLFGVVGVLVGLMVFAHFNVAIVSWLVIGVLFYTSFNLFYSLSRTRH